VFGVLYKDGLGFYKIKINFSLVQGGFSGEKRCHKFVQFLTKGLLFMK
jgi:hypothetical protein